MKKPKNHLICFPKRIEQVTFSLIYTPDKKESRIQHSLKTCLQGSHTRTLWTL